MIRSTRRAFAGTSIGAASWLLGACRSREQPAFDGGWVGDAVASGHRLRDAHTARPAAQQHRASLAIVGAGVAGLAAARAALRAGIDDLVLFDLHDTAGGNSRGHAMRAGPCPLGAHYLPLPGPDAHEVAEWLHEIGLARRELGRTVYDERHLCHSPQERLFIDGAWHEGILPPAAPGSAAHQQYRRFAQAVAQAQRELGFSQPTRRAVWTAAHAALDTIPFARWLDERGLADARLRWYLDYCCRDDYGADAAAVSAWAGLHYFASRHGFAAPGDDEGERDAVLTWPEGNAWLAHRLATPLGTRLHVRRLALRVAEQRHEVAIDVLDFDNGTIERWTAAQAVIALPLFVAGRIVESPPPALTAAAAVLRYAPWLVANVQLRQALLDRPGAPPAWDNVSYGRRSLGYVHAQHQSLAPSAGNTLLTAYHALPETERGALLAQPWQHWAQRVLDDLAATHPDLPHRCERIDLARHGHAMSIPAPGVRGHAALAALADGDAASRLHFAHADLAGYSVFEEAFTFGNAAGARAAQRLRGR
jgi:monoamine oxidase